MGISSLFYGLFKLESGTGCENTFPDGTGSREEERVYVGEFPRFSVCKRTNTQALNAPIFYV